LFSLSTGSLEAASPATLLAGKLLGWTKDDSTVVLAPGFGESDVSLYSIDDSIEPSIIWSKESDDYLSYNFSLDPTGRYLLISEYDKSEIFDIENEQFEEIYFESESNYLGSLEWSGAERYIMRNDQLWDLKQNDAFDILYGS